MATSPIPDKDTELTMCDVLQEEQELEEDANAVLGGSDDTHCSYEKGYVPRQALYACMTCCANGDAGVCLACCYACHDGHEIVELYTKRNFRCDCGNSKFNGQSCKLQTTKEPINSKNKYNHNFKGLYCTCSKPYPDPDDNIHDEMIQCIVCEDWFHGRHLGAKLPDDYFEIICGKCMESHKFLYSYLNTYNINVDVVRTTRSTSQSSMMETAIKDESVKSEAPEACNGVVDVVQSTSVKDEENKLDASKPSQETTTSELNGASDAPEGCMVKAEIDETSNGVNSEKKPITAVKVESNQPDIGSTKVESCILKSINADVDKTKGAGFWPENWRNELCRCANCMAMYGELQCEFLLNPDDTIQAYEERGKGYARESQYDKGLSALGQLDRVKQMEAVRAYTNMKGQLKEYLKEFADNKRTVCESDIKEFFERIGKKQKLNNVVPHFCR